MAENIFKRIDDFIKEYTLMDINGIQINCPYWMNKIKDGRVVLRGFQNGKGSAKEIKKELLSKVNVTISKLNLNEESIRKLAKRERIGIDCSGLAYRILDEFASLNHIGRMENVFDGGINRTSADTLTSEQFCNIITGFKSVQMGDLIRLMGGKHVLVVTGFSDGVISYVHSSHLSEIQGVHAGRIKLNNDLKPLDNQSWEEKTRKGENFGRKYFDSIKGDGIFRLKIFS